MTEPDLTTSGMFAGAYDRCYWGRLSSTERGSETITHEFASRPRQFASISICFTEIVYFKMSNTTFLRLLSPNLFTQVKQALQFKLQALSVTYQDDITSPEI